MPLRLASKLVMSEANACIFVDCVSLVKSLVSLRQQRQAESEVLFWCHTVIGN